MQVQDDDKPYDDINITPMLDLAYVLLVIFIIMTTATVQGQKVNLPKAQLRRASPRRRRRRLPSPMTARSFSTPYRSRCPSSNSAWCSRRR